MKKSLLCFAASCALVLVSCNSDGGSQKQEVPINTCNLVMAADGTGSMSIGTYKFTMEVNSGVQKMWISTNNLMINNSARTFTSDFLTPTYSSTGYQMILKNVNSAQDAGGVKISNGTFITSPFEQLPGDLDRMKVFTPTVKTSNGISYVPGTIYYPGMYGYLTQLIIANYTVDGGAYTVRTFMPDAFFYGDTSITDKSAAVGSPSSYYDKNTVYRIIIDMEKRKVSLVVYNLKLSSGAGTIPVLYYPGLDFKYTSNGYEITGTDIVAQCPPNNSGAYPDPEKMQSLPEYTLKSIALRTTNNLITNVNIAAEVGEKYRLAFNGCYIKVQESM